MPETVDELLSLSSKEKRGGRSPNADCALRTVMAKVIKFYVPKNFRKQLKWDPRPQRGRVIEFCSQVKKSA
jgi:hypothetical protein